MEKHRIAASNAPLILDWLKTRGGLALWRSADLSDPGKSWTTPVNSALGLPLGPPSWQSQALPYRIITTADEVEVIVPQEVKRFRVAVRIGAQGFKVKLTDASTKKVNAAVEKAGPDAWHEFDYSTQEAVILVPGETAPLA